MLSCQVRETDSLTEPSTRQDSSWPRNAKIQQPCFDRQPKQQQQSSLSSETKTDRHRPSNKLSSRLPPPNLPICPCVLAYCTTVTFAATRSLHPGLAHLPKSNLDVLLLHIPYTKYRQLFSPRPLFSAQIHTFDPSAFDFRACPKMISTAHTIRPATPLVSSPPVVSPEE
jgi:hypothetical protein